MAILAIFTGAINPAQYEALSQEIDWEGQQAQGAIGHAASFDAAGGIHVADVWESAEAMQAFVGQRLGPAFQKLGIAPPKVAVYRVHKLNVYKGHDPHRLADPTARQVRVAAPELDIAAWHPASA